MMRLPCIVCENGDPYSNIVCQDCEAQIEHRQETYDAMVSLVMDINNLVGYVPHEIVSEVHSQVKPVYELLSSIRVKDTRTQNEKERI